MVVGWLVGWLAGWLVGWLVSWLVGFVGWLVYVRLCAGAQQELFLRFHLPMTATNFKFKVSESFSDNQWGFDYDIDMTDL